MAHDKTLAAQLYSEMKALFPDNALEYSRTLYPGRAGVIPRTRDVSKLATPAAQGWHRLVYL